MTDSGLQSWQRPPFEPGNTLAVTHGATSPRTMGAVAEAFRSRLMAAESTPPYLHDPSYEDAIMAYCRACAIVKLLWDWADKQGIDVLMADETDETEDEERAYTKASDDAGSKRRTTRRTRSRHVSSVLEQIHKHENRAIKLRNALGLDPLARARLGRDVAAQKFDLAQAIAELSKQERSA